MTNTIRAVSLGAVHGVTTVSAAYTGADVPTDGSGGAFGYGVITGAGLEAIVVTTTSYAIEVLVKS